MRKIKIIHKLLLKNYCLWKFCNLISHDGGAEQNDKNHYRIFLLPQISKFSAVSRTEPWEQCFELFRMQNSKNFWGFALGPHWGWLTVPPRLPSCTTVFLLATLMEKPGPPKNWWIRHWSQCKINNQYIFSKHIDFKKFCKISGWEDRADQLLLQMSNSRQTFQIIHTLLLRILSFK